MSTISASTTTTTAYKVTADTTGTLVFQTGSTPTTAVTIDTSQNLLFNSGYGSVATAYGCRAWVNFNGTGTVAIRASANISSITDVGVGLYLANFATAMPDANFSSIASAQPNGYSGANAGTGDTSAGTQTTARASIEVRDYTNTNRDSDFIQLSVHR